MRTRAILTVAGLVLTTIWGIPTVATADETQSEKKQRTLGVLLYPGFELLDVYGPVEMFGNLGARMKIVMVAEEAGDVKSGQGPKGVADVGFADCPELDIVLVPGGFGTLQQLENEKLLDWLRAVSEEAELVTSVCTGSALLARAGLLDGHAATTNKQYYTLATTQSDKVDWQPSARWVEDGKWITSSGVTAGIDMALAIIAKLYGIEMAEGIAEGTEYIWNRDPENDPFARVIAEE